MLDYPFFTQFFKISNFITLIALVALGLSLLLLKRLTKKKVSFSNRMLIALVIG